MKIIVKGERIGGGGGGGGGLVRDGAISYPIQPMWPGSESKSRRHCC